MLQVLKEPLEHKVLKVIKVLLEGQVDLDPQVLKVIHDQLVIRVLLVQEDQQDLRVLKVLQEPLVLRVLLTQVHRVLQVQQVFQLVRLWLMVEVQHPLDGRYVMVLQRLPVHYKQFLVNLMCLIYEIDLLLVQVVVIVQKILVVQKMQFW